MTAHPRPGTALAALAIAQIVSWGVLYYAVLVAAPAIAADTGWNETSVFLAITAGLLASAVGAIPVGRLLDRRPRRVMVLGAIAGTLALLAAAASPTIVVFAAAWIACGAAQSAVLYQAAFTVVTHRYEGDRRGPLTLVTLAGGLASTVFAPLTGWLTSELGWRMAFVILAGVLAAVVIPTYALTVESGWLHIADPSAGSGTAREVLRTRRFWILTGSLALLSFSLYTVTLSAVPAALEKGLGLQAAAWTLGLIGAGQVLGRLFYLASPHAAAAWIAPALIGALGSASLAAFAFATQPGWVFVTAITAGAVRGALTLVQASAVADRWGAREYGRLNGVLAAPVSALTALSPGAAAAIASVEGSYQAMGYTMAAVCLIGGVLAARR